MKTRIQISSLQRDVVRDTFCIYLRIQKLDINYIFIFKFLSTTPLIYFATRDILRTLKLRCFQALISGNRVILENLDYCNKF